LSAFSGASTARLIIEVPVALPWHGHMPAVLPAFDF